MSTKRQIRELMASRLEAIRASQRAQKSLKASERLLSYLLQQMPTLSLLCCYQPFGTEIDCTPLFSRAREHHIELAFPRITTMKAPMGFFIADYRDPEAFETHRYGMRQPREGALEVDYSTFSREKVALIIPAAAYDRSGNRLGRGGGFYDRFLARYGTRVHSIGFAFEEQLVDSLTTEEHDKQVECIITDVATYGCVSEEF